MRQEEKILNEIKSGRRAMCGVADICRALKLPAKEKSAVKSLLDSLCANGELICDGGVYSTPEQWGAFCGTLRANQRGFAFITPDDRENFSGDFFVPKRGLNGALDMDKVLAVPVRGKGDEARVVKILERGRKVIVGMFEKDGRAGYVLPDKQSYASDVFIPLSLCGGAKRGDKVVAEITSYPRGKMVGGKITKILGRDGDFEAEEDGIIEGYELRREFSDDVKGQAAEMSRLPINTDGRRDLRSLFVITIDGEDTRDMDDAISIEMRGDNYLLGVHIADVAHYVKFKSALDNEAYARGTSVYFPDRVLPMLPTELSNGACSLNEGEDRYALSCFITFDGAGNRLKSEICESVIKSRKRLTYGEADRIIESAGGGGQAGESGFAGGENAGGEKGETSGKLEETLNLMAKLATILEEKRKKQGSLTLDVSETKIYLDEEGEIVIPEHKRTPSARLIEQFMVAANEEVATFLEKHKAPCLFRVHEKPAPEKAERFFSFLSDLGIAYRGDKGDVTPKDFQNILKKVENLPCAQVVNKVMLRSMQKARYSEKNLGHFGLASRCYCHFTSPIRRYPDLFVHRALKCALAGADENLMRLYRAGATETARAASDAERKADSAEQDVDNLYKVVYMSERIGEEYDAVISGVTSNGVFAELANGIEGIIRIENLPRDYYEFFEDKYLLKGKRHIYRIGDPIKIKVVGCDYSDMRAQFAVAGK